MIVTVFESLGEVVAVCCFNWDRTGFCILKKRLESGTFRLVPAAHGEAKHVEIDSGELALMLEGIELAGAKRRKRYSHSE